MSRPEILTLLVREYIMQDTPYGKIKRARYRCPKCLYLHSSKAMKFCSECGVKLRDD